VGERRHELKDSEWAAIADLFPAAKATGRPARSTREVFNGVMWVLKTGAPWRDLPDRYGPWQTVYRRFRAWDREGVLDRILKRLRLKLDEDGYIDWSEVFIDGSSVRASAAAAGAPKKRGSRSPPITP
jgi:transposase